MSIKIWHTDSPSALARGLALSQDLMKESRICELATKHFEEQESELRRKVSTTLRSFASMHKDGLTSSDLEQLADCVARGMNMELTPDKAKSVEEQP